MESRSGLRMRVAGAYILLCVMGVARRMVTRWLFTHFLVHRSAGRLRDQGTAGGDRRFPFQDLGGSGSSSRRVPAAAGVFGILHSKSVQIPLAASDERGVV